MKSSILSPHSELLLRTAFKSQWEDAWIAWKGNWAGKRVRDLVEGDLPENTDCYYCPALLKEDATARTNANAARVMVLVLDDVGTKIDRELFDLTFPLEPSYTIETSPGNFQYGFFIKGGLAPDDYEALRRGMKTSTVWGHADGIDPVHLFRLPQGTNTKAQAQDWKVAS